MGRKKTQSEEQELRDLITQYESASAANKSIYLDGDQIANIADWYATERKFEQAQQAITYGLYLHPGHTELLIEQSYLYLDTGLLQKAKEVANCITEEYETDVKLLKAELLLNEGQLDTADELLESIEEQEELDTIIDVAYLYIDMGYPEKALPWLNKGIHNYSEDENFLAVVAECYRSNEDQNEKAIFFYNKLIDKDPYNPIYWTGLSKCHFNLQMYDKAIEAADFALAADENYGEAHAIKAHCYFQLNNSEESIKEYKLAFAHKGLAPEFAFTFIGLTYINNEQWEDAYKSFNKALEAIGDEDSPLLTDLYTNAAFSLVKMGQGKEAHQLCDKAKAITPHDSSIYLMEGRIYMEEDNFEEAKQAWALALRYSPEIETLVMIGDYSLEYGLAANARVCFEEAWKDDSGYKGLNNRLATVCIMMKDAAGFCKYNKLSENPLIISDIYKMFSELKSPEVMEEFEKFAEEVRRLEK